MNRLTFASLLVYLTTLPVVAYLDSVDREVRALSVVHLYASLAPAAALPKLLELEMAEPVVAAACMSAVVEALVPEASDAAAHSLFELLFLALLATRGTKLPLWARLGGALAALGEAMQAAALFGAPALEGVGFGVAVGEMAFYGGLLRL